MAYNNPRDSDSRNRQGNYPGDGQRQSRPQAITVREPTPCNITANMFKYTGKDVILHQYAVTFTPEIMRKNIFQKFMRMVEINDFKEPFAFDGASILVSSKKFSDVTLTCPMKEGDLKCRIEYKHTHDSRDSSKENPGLGQCMEIVSRYYQKIRFLVDKSRMFDLKSRPFDLGCGLEIIPGLTASVKFIKAGIFLNLDMAFGVFHKPLPLIELLFQLAESRAPRGRGSVNPLKDDLGANFYYDFEKLIKNIKVSTNHREKPSSFKVSGLITQPASSVEFEIDGKKWTVAEYFAKTYKPLKHPHLPLVVIKKRELTIHLPLEVLEISCGQKYIKKLDEGMTSSMIKIAAKRPNERFETIANKARDLAAFQNDTLKSFGMVFDNKMLNCKGLILPPPQISFSNNRKVQVSNGSWNLIGVSALEGSKIVDWKIFIFRSNDTIRNDTIDAFVSIAQKYGVTFSSSPQTVVVRNMNEFLDAKKSKFNLVILPDKSAQRYEEIKRIAETYNAVYTQCMVASNIPKLSNPSFASNLLLKINAKLGGKNWCIDQKLFGDKPTILFGIDVNHPGVADLESPSIVSVVASMDYNFVNYKTIIEQQERRQEIILSLSQSVKTLLKNHYASTKTKPARIVVFRDGVGDTMFDAVYNCEIESIKQACHEIDQSYDPEINFIIAQKKHSIRFMSNGNNLVPGTIVDEVSTPGAFDFYLVSHHALQGTARPVRYVIVKNDSKFTAMQLYESVYALCHLYARATKSVSVVPPIYYAHLGAARGKCYLEKNKDGVFNMRACDKDIQKTLYYL